MISIKKRRPLLVEGSLRVTFTKDDILIEDFIEQKDHPYVLYDLHGNVKETNLNCEKPMYETYKWVHKTALYLIKEEFYADSI